jgi:uncharacterized protein (DUF427 family)
MRGSDMAAEAFRADDADLRDYVIFSFDRPLLVFETMLPVRCYFPADAVRAPLVTSETHLICPYKGRARYWNVELAE